MTKTRNILPSYTELHRIFYYNESTGILKRKVRLVNAHKLDEAVGWENTDGRLRTDINGVTYLVHRIIWKMMLDEEPPEEIDHKDTNFKNNKWDNLREALRGENIANSKLSKANNSGYKGVSQTPSGRWKARIMINYKDITIGIYNTIEEAALARRDYAVAKRKEFARETMDFK